MKVQREIPIRSFTARRLAAALAFTTAGGVMAVALATPAYAQDADASLRGSATLDGAAAASEVVAVDVNSGFRRSAEVHSDGSFNFPSLRPGTYRLELQTADGVKQTDEFTLVVGQNAVLDFDFSADGGEEYSDEGTIVVTASRIKSLQGGEVGAIISSRLIESLPQNNRNFLAFADLAPGVTVAQEGGGQIRLQSGNSNPSSIAVFIDGVNQKDLVQRGGVSGQDSTPGNPFPQLAVGEYRVLTSNYDAEFDTVGSAAVIALTKSGTNEFHGEAFVDYTDQSLRARTPTEAANDSTKIDTKDIQYGGALGGPIIKDVAHFFVSYEGKEFNSPRTITPSVRPESAFPAELQAKFGPTSQEFNENLFFGKIDFVPSTADLIELSAKYRDESSIPIGDGNSAPESFPDLQNKEFRGLLRYEHTADNWVNDLKIEYQRTRNQPTPRTDESRREFVQVTATGTGGFNTQTLFVDGGSDNNQDSRQRGFTISDDFTYTGFSRHSIKAGVKLGFITLNRLENFAQNGVYRYNADFLPSGGSFNTTIPFEVRLATSPVGGDPSLSEKNFRIGLYIQDDWDITDRLQVNLGLRWDYSRLKNYVNFVTPDALADAFSPANYPNLVNADYDIGDYLSDGTNRQTFTGAFAPRFGFTYLLDDEGRFAIFGGAGRSYDYTQYTLLALERVRTSFRQRTIQFVTGDPTTGCFVDNGTTCRTFDPVFLTAAGRATLNDALQGIQGIEPFLNNNDIKVPYFDQFSLGVRGKFGLFDAEVGYQHIAGEDGLVATFGTRRPDGTFFPPTTEQQNSPNGAANQPPLLGNNFVLLSNGLSSRSDSVYVKVNKRYTESSPWSLDAIYTYTSGEDNFAGADFGFPFFGDYAFPRDVPFSRSRQGVTHRLVVAGSVDIPWDITLASRVTLASPATVKGVYTSTATDPQPFFREVRNTTVSDSFSQVDISATKAVSLGFISDDTRLKFRIDVLNIFNTRNFTNFEGFAGSPNFGQQNGTGIGGNPTRTIKFSTGFEF
ncbi:MAG: TonB-dependent receptor [Erythrobacter sp.]|jgi:hypothetical protein